VHSIGPWWHVVFPIVEAAGRTVPKLEDNAAVPAVKDLEFAIIREVRKERRGKVVHEVPGRGRQGAVRGFELLEGHPDALQGEADVILMHLRNVPGGTGTPVFRLESVNAPTSIVEAPNVAAIAARKSGISGAQEEGERIAVKTPTAVKHDDASFRFRRGLGTAMAVVTLFPDLVPELGLSLEYEPVLAGCSMRESEVVNL